ncbi:TIGR00266 family protein [Herpetosiphon giganteus]|uniref:TIGR00266 family protein n=1 Tax=Herpetosiphon giganteus TaxID=2029754 RepID=UPI00195918FE|nr:TIGR00266 family protein [Herpetosiphon giganteus]MBM7842220.1 uncharacterized protein (TIGR00266 family) [Herpetosiphon giganteus]
MSENDYRPKFDPQTGQPIPNQPNYNQPQGGYPPPPPQPNYGAPPEGAYTVASEPGRPLDLPEPQVALSGRGMTTGLRYKVIGSVLQAVIIELDPGQMIFSESGGMSWMSGNVQMNTNSGGGIGKMFKRAFSGESLFIVDFTVAGGTGLIGFASEMPGKVVPLHLAPGQEIIMQKDSFMCAEKSVQLDIHFRRKLGAGLFGGEGFIMQRATGPGVVFAELDGEVVEYYLQPGQVMKVDTGHVAMYEPSVQFDIEMVRGFKNILFGGEGLFLATLRGPGKIWLQTMPVMNVAKKLAEYMPASGGGGSAGGNIIGSLLGGD